MDFEIHFHSFSWNISVVCLNRLGYFVCHGSNVCKLPFQFAFKTLKDFLFLKIFCHQRVWNLLSLEMFSVLASSQICWSWSTQHNFLVQNKWESSQDEGKQITSLTKLQGPTMIMSKPNAYLRSKVQGPWSNNMKW